MSSNLPDGNAPPFISTSVGDSTSPIISRQEEIMQQIDEMNIPLASEDPGSEGNTLGTNTDVSNAVRDDAIENNDNSTHKSKRPKTSTVWQDFKEVTDTDGVAKISCNHCKKMFAKMKTTPTSQLRRHLNSCTIYVKAKAAKDKGKLAQTQLGFVPTTVDPTSSPALHDGKFDMEKMKESMAHWIMMHEHPFSIVEDEGFNLMQKRGMPDWRAISRVTARNHCVNVYEMEKKKLKALLKNVNKISLTTDCWKSKNQKIEYMVITGHWIDQNWHLQKRILNFVHIPPPRRGLEIANSIWRCLEEWGIDSKVHTISVDNASANDTAIDNLKVYIRNKKKLLCEGKLFHVRCCAHILNLIAQDGLSQIKEIIDIIRDSVEYVRRSDARLKVFSEIVKQLNLPDRKLIDDCRTRWNSTYEMLAAAIKFKDVFPRFADREPHFDICPTDEDWTKVQKVCSVLEVFWVATHIISGSEYPTSNLFLNEVSRVKVVLDKKALDSDDYFIMDMVGRMKMKFDKYWGSSKLLMSIAAVLDPRCKMRALQFCFPKLYSPLQVEREIAHVRQKLYELYSEYVAQHNLDEEMTDEVQERMFKVEVQIVQLLDLVGLSITIS